MRRLVFPYLFIPAVTLLTGCGTTGPRLPKLTYDEAAAFERTLQARELKPIQPPEGRLYTQPLNKKEPCKLGTTQDQLNRSNFRAYWDGQCKNGYAFGLGRDIAVSDTHHYEEITIYSELGDTFGSPSVHYDFVNFEVVHRTAFDPYPKHNAIYERISNDTKGFTIGYQLMSTDVSGRTKMLEFSPLGPARIFVSHERNIQYKFTDNTKFPLLMAEQTKFGAEIVDPKTQKAGGVAAIVFGNGQERHFRHTATNPELVQLPSEYVAHLNAKMKETADQVNMVEGSLEPARKMEREYLYLACNGKHTIDGLEPEVAKKICTWRNQFKEPYAKAIEKAKSQLDDLTKKAEAAAIERRNQQQVALEQRRIQAQQTQQDVQSFVAELNQASQQFLNNSVQMRNNVMSQPTPMPSFGLQGNNVVNCTTIGSITSCR